MMLKRPLGRSGLRTSILGLGTMNFGSEWCGRRFVDETTASSIIDAAIEAGVDLIDTADVYGLGASESMLGRLLVRRRNRVLLATKVCGEMRPGDPSSGGLSAKHIRDALDASLARLCTDHVDLYMAHAPDPGVPIEETLEAFGRAKKAGKARVVGCSNFSAAQWKEALALADGSLPRLEFNQVEFHLAARGVEEALAPLAAAEGVSVLAWSPLAGGGLTGRYPGDRRRSAALGLSASGLKGLSSVLDKAARSAGLTPGQTALGWAVSRPWVASAVFGASGQAQAGENLVARPLDSRLVSVLDKARSLCL
ncbi:MAG: aldo/keto reductase [Elusimicrobiota bacterium]|jgi:aryl-alcohol dehydrogenase-like predicted oxidoreductase